MGRGSITPPVEPSSPIDGSIRKRVCKACDRCRLKKSKCDGSSPCSRCRVDNAICVFGERKKSQDRIYPKGYVEMLEHQQSQLVAGLHELYRRLQAGENWTGAPLRETTQGMPLTHDILERLGALHQDSHENTDHFDDNLASMQSRLSASDAGFTHGESGPDSNSESAQSPVFESFPQRKTPLFTNPFTINQFPPTPPTQSPRVSMVKTRSPLQNQFPCTSTSITNMPWQAEPYEYIDNLDYDMAYEAPIPDTLFQDFNTTTAMYHDPAGTGINPCLTMKDWQPQDDQIRHYFRNGVFT